MKYLFLLLIFAVSLSAHALDEMGREGGGTGGDPSCLSEQDCSEAPDFLKKAKMIRAEVSRCQENEGDAAFANCVQQLFSELQ